MKYTARNTLGVALMVSVVLHAALLTLVRAPSEPQPDETFPLALQSAEPTPSPRPIPPPRPKPRPTMTPHAAQHIQPRRPWVKVAHQLSHPRSIAPRHVAPEPRASSGGGRTTSGDGNRDGIGKAPPVETSPSAPHPSPSPTPPPACVQPNAPAATIEPAVPETPSLAAEQGISGIVTVAVSLDERSRVTGARIVTSPSALLDDAALRAARASTFRTAVRDCRPIAADYAFIVEFSAQ